MLQVWWHPLQVDENNIYLPRGSRVLSFCADSFGSLGIWVLITDMMVQETRKFYVCMPGHMIPWDMPNLRFLGNCLSIRNNMMASYFCFEIEVQPSLFPN